MDITRGSFDDFPSRCSSSSSSRFNYTHSSLEILSTENVESQHLFMSEELSEEEEEEATRINHNKENHPHNINATYAKSDTLSDVVMDTRMEKAIRKMKHLDKLLADVVKKEREVKQSHAEGYASMIVDLKSLSTGTKNVAESKQNINKFLSLMPPSGCDITEKSSDDFQPIFATQPDQDQVSSSQGDSPTRDTHDRRSVTTTRSTSDSESKRKQSSKNMKKKFDFIKRNIELAKDAGSSFAMTTEEKHRLDDLLSNIDEIDDSADTTATIEYDNVYCYDDDTLQRITRIDERIEEIGSRLSFHSIARDYRLPLSDDDAFSLDDESANNVDSAFKRLEDIQERLDKLDEEWKTKFTFSKPQLDKDDLESLLSDCSHELLSISSYRSSEIGSEVNSSSVFSGPRPAWNDEPNGDGESVVSCITVEPLHRDVLDRLLSEARTSLGIAECGSDEDSTPMNSEDEDAVSFD